MTRKEKAMIRNSILALAVVLGTAGWSWAQLPSISPPPVNLMPGRMQSVRLQPQPKGSQLQGTWYVNGNPNQPALFEITPRGTRIRDALLTNPSGMQSQATIYWRGHTIVAPAYGLRGRFNNNTIRWSNGTTWTRR
jgi:hypothetical protein